MNMKGRKAKMAAGLTAGAMLLGLTGPMAIAETVKGDMSHDARANAADMAEVKTQAQLQAGTDVLGGDLPVLGDVNALVTNLMSLVFGVISDSDVPGADVLETDLPGVDPLQNKGVKPLASDIISDSDVPGTDMPGADVIPDQDMVPGLK